MHLSHAVESPTQPAMRERRPFSAVVQGGQGGALAACVSARPAGISSSVDAPHAVSGWHALVLTAYAEQRVHDSGDPGAELAALLRGLRSVDRTWILLYWTLSPRPGPRLAVARAAPHLPLGVGLRSALESLASDLDPEVGRAAHAALRRCAWARTDVVARSARASYASGVQ